MKALPILFLTLLVTSCGFYIPQSADVPLINHKNDIRIDAGANRLFTAGMATVSYGLTDKVAVQAYGSLGSNNRYFYHGALGWYKNLENRNVMEVYVGAGNGYGYNSNHDTGTDKSGNYQVYFSQFNYGKLGGESGIWDLGFGLKAGIFHSNILTEYDPVMSGNQPSLTNIDNNLLIEPNFFVRIGDDHVKFSVKMSSVYISGHNNSASLPYFPLNLGVGLNIRL